MVMNLRASLQLWCKSPEQNFALCSSEMFKQRLSFLNREHRMGSQRGQVLTKEGCLEALPLHCIL